MSDPVLMTLDEAAERLLVSRRTVERAIAAGRLSRIKIGKAVRIHPDDLDAYVSDCRVS